MPTLPLRAAAYTRTGILRRFLELIAEAAPARVDNRWAAEKLDLKGGDVRAFLQSVRVLGLVDPYGTLTEAGRRSRSTAQRPQVVHEGLRAAYPELEQRWAEAGGMPRSEVEDFFKISYGLSTSTAVPAAKLYCDLKREYAAAGQAPPAPVASAPSPAEAPAAPPAAEPPPLPAARVAAATENDVRIAAAAALSSAVQLHITADWDTDRLTLALDRMERMLLMLLPAGSAPTAPGGDRR